ncbi:LacI family DNA-binding transcriptional regulator [Opitutus terrae]|uniref:Transcriptional regulator, LacI family n=1 Tax=Opitutus terrae (strain DSM 11246 / JCM 15787 / PB90-1) TaxID=452637 RepID=B1ZRG5_OPITP|nr:LacI family DNA-binding transcriptional regulator [Opitutus terrae]ACB77615.1 transcriptional regulator, LacI family [Opitutus terrae PB90-1]
MNLRHLARLAQLSPSAVSLALRDSPKISVATRKLVRELADKTGYRPDAKVVAMMTHLRKPRAVRQQACFGVVSFYNHPRPWETSKHLTRIYEGMQKRATELGYRLEPLWLRAPGMTYRRFRTILDARGIEGLLCFGSPDLEQDFPEELDSYAIVTVGLSIRTRLHRITSHFYNDTMHVLNRLHALGYRRPGLVVGRYEEARSGHAHTSAYLGWCEHRLGPGQSLPVHLVEHVDAKPLLEWLRRQRPDVLVFVHLYDVLPELRAVLRKNELSVPQQLGVAALSQFLEGSGFSGLQQNQPLMGAWAVELLAARIANHDLGIPANPRIEMVESHWVENHSLRSQLSVNS